MIFQLIGEQTGESVKNMAQGAFDGVKNSLGMNEKKWGNEYSYFSNNYLFIHGYFWCLAIFYFSKLCL